MHTVHMYSMLLSMVKLTTEQQKVLDFVMDEQERTGSSPTVREIASHFGYKSPNNASQHLRLIERKGYIRRLPGRARGVEVLVQREGSGTDNTVEVPLVGTIAAGAPLLATENIDCTIALDRGLFRGHDMFSLHVKGDSMKNIGILTGDIAVIQQQQAVDDGEVAAVIVEGEATLKRLSIEGSKVVLRAENEDFDDIVITSDRDVQVVGKLVGVMRKC